MKKIIVLHFADGEVYVYDYDPNVWEDAEDFLSSEEIALEHNNCQWMIVDELKINVM